MGAPYIYDISRLRVNDHNNLSLCVTLPVLYTKRSHQIIPTLLIGEVMGFLY